MKRRPAHSVTERQLVIALAETGRLVSLHDIGAWRRAHLLPRFWGRVGGSSRSSYWANPDIQVQAQTVYDALNLSPRIELALISVWLLGFEVDLSRVRRSLLHGVRVRSASASVSATSRSEGGFEQNLRLLRHALNGSIENTNADQLSAAPSCAQPGIKQAKALRSAARSDLEKWALLYQPLIGSADLIRGSSDRVLLDARDSLLKLLKAEEKAIGRILSFQPLFLFILALMVAGEGDCLPMIDGSDHVSGPPAVPPGQTATPFLRAAS